MLALCVLATSCGEAPTPPFAVVQNSFERGSTAAALPVHRNTLRDRIHRISEITGVDLNTAQGRGLAWLAWLERRDSGSEPSTD